jgi:F-type H+-transporting ATPase subunit delta
MLSSLIAQRYAKALFAAAQSAGELERVAAEAQALAAALDPATLSVVSRPTLAPSEKLGYFTKALGPEASKTLPQFLRTVLETKRERFLPPMFKAFQALVRESQGRLTGTVASAVSLSPAQLQAVGDGLAKRFGRPVDLSPLVDPALLGGLRLQVGDTVYDGTLASRLEKLGRRMAGTDTGDGPKKA